MHACKLSNLEQSLMSNNLHAMQASAVSLPATYASHHDQVMLEVADISQDDGRA